jgi:hypothetical protein
VNALDHIFYSAFIPHADRKAISDESMIKAEPKRIKKYHFRAPVYSLSQTRSVSNSIFEGFTKPQKSIFEIENRK